MINAQKVSKVAFSRQLCRIRDANGPPKTRKAIGSTREATEKLQGDLAPVYSHNKFYWYINTTPRMAYPALRTTKEDDNVDFQSSSSASTLHISSSVQAKALEREFFLLHSVRSAQNVFLRYESLSPRKREKETLNALLLLEKTRILNVRRTSKRFGDTSSGDT